MKTFLIAIVFLVVLAIGGIFVLKAFQAKAPKGAVSRTITLTGTLQAITSNGEYSDVILVNGQSVGVNSTRLDLKPYEGKNVKIVGEYSGSTMYADSVTVLP